MSKKKDRTPAELAALPDDALVNDAEMHSLLSISRVTAWRMDKDGSLPPPVWLGETRIKRRRLGDIRAVIRGEWKGKEAA